MKAKLGLLVGICCMLTNGIVVAAEQSIDPFLVMFGNSRKFTEQDIPVLADYDVMLLDRNRYSYINNKTWKEIKKASPNTKIYLYQLGPIVASNTDSRPVYNLNNLGRFETARGSKDGSLSKDHPDWFLKNIFGQRVNIRSYPHQYYLDFGNQQFIDYWVKHTVQDIVLQEWKADGIFIDVAHACQANVLKSFAGFTPAKYLSCESWNTNMNAFLEKVAVELGKHNQLVAANRGQSKHEKGTKAWLDLDKISLPLDFLVEEGAFATSWGEGDVAFLPVDEWKRQVDLPASIKQSSIGMISHTALAKGAVGVASNGERVTYDQILRFSAASYLLARNIAKPNTYFFFNDNRAEDHYSKLVSTQMFREFDIGTPQARYEKVEDEEIYFRKYSDGYVYVNPMNKKVKDIKLPANFRPGLDNKGVKKVGAFWYMDLERHDAAIVKAAVEIVLPASPSFELQ